MPDKVILIDPETKSVKVIEVTFDPDSFKPIYPILDCDLVEIIQLTKHLRLIIDEEGLLKPNHFFHLRGLPHLAGNPFAGKAIVCAVDKEDNFIGLREAALEEFTSFAPNKVIQFEGNDLEADAAMTAGRMKRPMTTIDGLTDDFRPAGSPEVIWKWTPNMPASEEEARQ